jgi:quercetin dioxygenase-like cupin family protein
VSLPATIQAHSLPVLLKPPSLWPSPVRAFPLRPDFLEKVATAVASAVRPWHPEVPEDPGDRSGTRLMATDEYDAWLLGWPPGTRVTPHDHGDSAGSFCVVGGELWEVRWGGGRRRTRRVGPGQTVTIARGVVHDVLAYGPGALSVHVYSPPLTSMSFFDDSGQQRVDILPVEPGDGATPPGRAWHPAGGR